MSDSPIWRRYRRFRGADVRADVTDELEFHVEMIAARHVARGMPADRARARALEEFGDLARARRLCEEIGERRRRRHEWAELVHSAVADARFGVRWLRRAPGFSVTIILTLALGIGASTAIFSIVRGVLLRPLPFAGPDRIVQIWERSPQGDDHNVVSGGNYESWRARVRSFTELGAYSGPFGVGLTGDGEPAQIIATDVTPAVMRILGARPALGRTLVPDDALGGGRVVILSHTFWRRRFRGDSAIVGKRIMLEERPYAVAGVMRAEFEFPAPGVDVWRPVTVGDIDPNERRSHNWRVVGRLAPGATRESAAAEMDALAGALAREYPQYMTGYGVNVVALGDDIVRGVRPLLLILLAGATLLLVVACVNIANLLLARSVARRREMAVRGALGAGSARLVRQVLTESLVVAAIGGLLGTAMAWMMSRGLLALAPRDIPRLAGVRLDAIVLGYAGVATVLSGMTFGLAPAVRLAAPRRHGAHALHSVLRATDHRGGGGRQQPARAMLLIAELAISLVLLVGAGLLLRSAARLAAVDYGFRPDGLVTAALDLPRLRYDSTARHVAFYDDVIDRIRLLPHVRGAAGTTETLGGTGAMTFSFAIEGRPATHPNGREDPQPLRAVAGDYFRVMGIPILRGRAFESRDRADAPPVVIVNQSLARSLWRGDDPVGSRISFVGPAGPWLEVIGVAGDTRSGAADEPASPALFMPYAQKRWPWMAWLTLVVRGDGQTDARVLGDEVRGAVWQADRQLPIQRVATMNQLFTESIGRRRFATVLTGAFAVAALLLGMIGMYGVLSYTVVQRRREFGIRIALGARGAQVTRGVVQEALVLAGVAVVVGTVAALFVMRPLGALLFEVSPTDPATFAAVAALVVVVAGVAAWLPARRATRIDPVATMRES